MLTSEKAKILVIDDECSLAFCIKANLEWTEQYEVIVASDGKHGLKAAKHEHPDLILLDIFMPEMDGLEVLKKLKEDSRTVSIPVLMLTAVTNQEIRQQAARLYDEGYIEKPFRMETLTAKIEEVLSRAKSLC